MTPTDGMERLRAEIAEIVRRLRDAEYIGGHTDAAENIINVVAAGLGVVSRASVDVMAERRRQIEAEGWDTAHDDAHSSGELAKAASCYAWQGGMDSKTYELASFMGEPEGWPWADEWWKPKDPRRDLVRAGALIQAEIERLDRAATLPTAATEAQEKTDASIS